MNPIGYTATADGSAYCSACVRSIGGGMVPIFANDEADTPTHCTRCEALIPHALTAEGYDYVADAIGEHLRDPETNGRACIVAAWFRQYRDGFDRHGLAVRILDLWADAQPSTDRFTPNAALRNEAWH